MRALVAALAVGLVATATSGSDGTARFTIRPTTTATYRARLAGSDAAGSTVSEPVAIAVRYRVALRPAPGPAPLAARVGRPVRFTATVRPETASAVDVVRTGVTFTVERRSGSSWRIVSRTTVIVPRTGVAKFTFRPPRAGTWAVRAAAGATTSNAASGESPRTIVVAR